MEGLCLGEFRKRWVCSQEPPAQAVMATSAHAAWPGVRGPGGGAPATSGGSRGTGGARFPCTEGGDTARLAQRPTPGDAHNQRRALCSVGRRLSGDVE